MYRILITLVITLTATMSYSAKAEDPFGLDPGEAKDKAVFNAWLANPANAPAHPLIWLRAVARSKQPQRANYFKYFYKQTGTKAKKTIAVMDSLADDLFSFDALIAEPYPSAGQKKEIEAVRARISKSADAFFAIYNREYRLKVYKVAEKFEGARLLIMDLNRLRQTEITDEWMVTLREQEKQARKGYLFGMLEGKDPATAQKIMDDYRDTIRFLLTFANPPEELKGKALAKFKANQVKLRNAILNKALIFKY
jgi:hypothetical protein